MQLAILLGIGEIAAGPDTLVQSSVSAFCAISCKWFDSNEATP